MATTVTLFQNWIVCSEVVITYRKLWEDDPKTIITHGSMKTVEEFQIVLCAIQYTLILEHTAVAKKIRIPIT